MLILLILSLLAICAAADETDDEPKPVSADVGLQIKHCHPGDSALVTVTPIPENDNRRGGFFVTTNNLLVLRDLSMLPSGLNRLQIQSICRGMTGEVANVVVDLRRPPPPPKLELMELVKVRRVRPGSPVPLRSSVTNKVPSPPLPPGLVMALPDAETNRMSYKDSQMMKAYYSKPGRRNQ